MAKFAAVLTRRTPTSLFYAADNKRFTVCRRMSQSGIISKSSLEIKSTDSLSENIIFESFFRNLD